MTSAGRVNTVDEAYRMSEGHETMGEEHRRKSAPRGGATPLRGASPTEGTPTDMASLPYPPDTASTETITWTRRGLILVATEPPPVEQIPEPAAEPTLPRGVHHLVACPTCRARVDETCRTSSGHTTTPHRSRLAPRLCPCGSLLAPRRRYCDPCRDRADQENRYAGVVRFRAQMREAS